MLDSYDITTLSLPAAPVGWLSSFHSKGDSMKDMNSNAEGAGRSWNFNSYLRQLNGSYEIEKVLSKEGADCIQIDTSTAPCLGVSREPEMVGPSEGAGWSAMVKTVGEPGDESINASSGLRAAPVVEVSQSGPISDCFETTLDCTPAAPVATPAQAHPGDRAEPLAPRSSEGAGGVGGSDDYRDVAGGVYPDAERGRVVWSEIGSLYLQDDGYWRPLRGRGGPTGEPGATGGETPTRHVEPVSQRGRVVLGEVDPGAASERDGRFSQGGRPVGHGLVELPNGVLVNPQHVVAVEGGRIAIEHGLLDCVIVRTVLSDVAYRFDVPLVHPITGELLDMAERAGIADGIRGQILDCIGCRDVLSG